MTRVSLHEPSILYPSKEKLDHEAAGGTTVKSMAYLILGVATFLDMLPEEPIVTACKRRLRSFNH
ncbi:hypothetical protein VTK26DRAFT_3044 [Humicola hyalothermophila]